MKDAKNADSIIVAVAHDEFKTLIINDLDDLFKEGNPEEKVLIDVKDIYKIKEVEEKGFTYWRL